MEPVSYLAGLLEGEGSFSISLINKILKINVKMCDREPLEKIQQIMGGRIYGPYKPRGLSRKPIYLYELCHRHLVLQWIEKIYPFMSPRRQLQIENMVKFDMAYPLTRTSNPDTDRAITNEEQREYYRIRQLSGLS